MATWNAFSNSVLTQSNSIVYNAAGNIESKSDVGYTNMTYGEINGKPHALTSLTAPAAVSDLNITYTGFNKIKTLSLPQENKTYTLTYGVDNQRRSSVYKEGNVTKLTRYYAGNYEEEVNSSGNVRKIHYLYGAVFIQNGGKDSLLYTYTDYLGSLTALTDQAGNEIQRYAYDPWGARRNPADWSKPDNRTGWILNRGFTGHEHIDQFGIINMNGRAYDPLTAQFLSPDPYVQDTENWINYNRYAYCLHNPVKYTDPSGNEFVDFYGNKSDKEKDQLIKNIETQRAMWKTKMEEQRKQMDLHKWDVNLTKYENAKNAYEDYGERIKNLDQSIIDINFLHADTENKYAFNKTNGGKHFVVKDPNGIVYIETSGDEFSIHEITHIRQSLKAGGLKFGTKGAEKNKLLNAGTGISPFRRSYNEVEAYQMQHSFNGSFRGARFLNEINYNSVGNMRNENYPFELIYPEIHLYARSLKK